MAEEFQIRGVIARITWSYYTCAAIHGYTVRVNKKTRAGSLRATIVESDAFKLTQRPLEFVAPIHKGTMRWEIVSHSISNGTVTATLAPIKESV